MVEDLSYTSAEIEALKAAAQERGLDPESFSFEVLNKLTAKLGYKITTDILPPVSEPEDDTPEIDWAVDPFEGTNSEGGNRGFGFFADRTTPKELRPPDRLVEENRPKKPQKNSASVGKKTVDLLLWMQIQAHLDAGKEPFGVPEKIVYEDEEGVKEENLVSKEQWDNAIGGRIGDNLIRFIAGVSAEQGAHYKSVQALIRRQKHSSKDVGVEITPEQLNILIAQKIMDINVPFKSLVGFLYAANDLRQEDVTKLTRENFIGNLKAEENARYFVRKNILTASDLLLPKGADGKPSHDHLSTWFQKAREADRTFSLNILVNKIVEVLTQDEVERQTFLSAITFPEFNKTLPDKLLESKKTLKLFIAENFGDDHDSVTRFFGLLQSKLPHNHPLKNYEIRKIERFEPLIQRSEHLVVAVWATVEGALENFTKGPMLKSELPRAAEILQLLDRLDPKQEEKSSLRKVFRNKYGQNKSRVRHNHCSKTRRMGIF